MKLTYITSLLFALAASSVYAASVNTYFSAVSSSLNARTGFVDTNGTAITYSPDNVWIFNSDKATTSGTGTTLTANIYTDQMTPTPYNVTENAGIKFEKFGSTLRWVNVAFYLDAASKALNFTNSLGEKNVFLINGDLTREQGTAGLAGSEAQVYIKLENRAPAASGYSITSADNMGLHVTGNVNFSSSSSTLTLSTYLGGTGNDVATNTSTGSSGVNLKSLTVDGTFTLGEYERVNVNVGKYYTSTTLSDKSYDTADAQLKSGLYVGNLASFHLHHAGTSSNAHKAVYEINGLYATDYGKIQNSNNSGAESLTIVVFNNGASVDASYKGRISDVSETAYGSAVNSHTKLVMKGHADSVQRLDIDSYFTGGVDVVSGTLVIRQRNDISMGNLLVKGGTFSIDSEGWGTNKAVFDNASYEGGTLHFGLGETKSDCLILNGVLTNDSGGKIVVDFDLTNVTLDKDYGIVIWGDKGSLTSDDFVCITDLSGAGVEEVLFDVYEGVLSVTFSSIPEPATIAAILGAIALTFAVLRRRK